MPFRVERTPGNVRHGGGDTVCVNARDWEADRKEERGRTVKTKRVKMRERKLSKGLR